MCLRCIQSCIEIPGCHVLDVVDRGFESHLPCWGPDREPQSYQRSALADGTGSDNVYLLWLRMPARSECAPWQASD
jgi:hypothetical protein